jgi:hypothetical protein
MALIIFAATYLTAACVYLAVVRLAVGDRARAFKAFSPGMLPPLGIIFGLLIGFVAVQVWNDFDKAKLAVATEASALRAVVLLGETLPDEQRTHLGALINRHIEEAVNREWPAMSHERIFILNCIFAWPREVTTESVLYTAPPGIGSRRTATSRQISRPRHGSLARGFGKRRP